MIFNFPNNETNGMINRIQIKPPVQHGFLFMILRQIRQQKYYIQIHMHQEGSPSSKPKFKAKSQKILRLHTVEKETDIEEHNLFLKKRVSTKIRINSLKTIYPNSIHHKVRKYTEIQEELTLPDSTCKLSPLKQYETKLKLSAQSWVIHDMKTNLYKRGWKPNKPSQFNGLFKLLLLLVYAQIIKQNHKLKKLKVKINPDHLKESRLINSKKDQNHLKWIVGSKKTNKTLPKASIVYLIDIVKSMIISGSNDLFEYSLIYCGYLIALLKQSSANGSIDAIVNLTQERQDETYANEFCRFCNDFFLSSIGLQNSRIQNQEQGYELWSTSNEICKIFIKGFYDYPFFRQTISMQTHSFYIKYQVGYNYWEDRMLSIKTPNGEMKSHYFCYVVYKGMRNYQALCYNTELDILMVIEDSKFSMAELDIKVLEKWYHNVTKPIGSSEKNKSTVFSPPKHKKSLLPILAISKG